jgi:hypothetical protein
MKPILALALLLAVAGCSLSPKPVTTPPPSPRITPPSLTSMAPCEGPVQLRAGPLTQQQVENLWGVDDDRLVECAARHKILANYIRKRDAGLTSQPKGKSK